LTGVVPGFLKPMGTEVLFFFCLSLPLLGLEDKLLEKTFFLMKIEIRLSRKLAVIP